MANSTLNIKTPRGVIFHTSGKGGKTTAKLEWNPGLGPQMTAGLNRAQKFLDSEVLRQNSPYVPLDTSMLQKSGTLGTVIGSGEVNYISPYAARNYYNPQFNFQGAPQRGGMWFERMKADHGKEIIDGAKKIGGGRG